MCFLYPIGGGNFKIYIEGFWFYEAHNDVKKMISIWF